MKNSLSSFLKKDLLLVESSDGRLQPCQTPVTFPPRTCLHMAYVPVVAI